MRSLEALLRPFGNGLKWSILVASAFMLSACMATQFIPREDGGFRYLDYRGSPYDQSRTPYPGINQIQCPPPARPYCGD